MLMSEWWTVDSLSPNLLTMVRSEPDYHLVVLIVRLGPILWPLFRKVAFFFYFYFFNIFYLFQYSKARENAPPVLLTRPSVPTSHLGSLRQKVEVNQRKSTNIANTRNKRTNGPKIKEGRQRRRMCCPPYRGLFNMYSTAHVFNTVTEKQMGFSA